MDIFDFHVHLPVKGFDPQFASFFKRYAQERGTDRLAKVRSWSAEYDRMWRRHWGFPEPEPALPAAEAAARWYREIKSAGLSGAVIATGGGNRILAKAIEPYRERLTGFAHHRPADPDAADELKTAVMELGFKGYKVFAPLVEIPLADRSLTALWEVAGNTACRCWFILHTGRRRRHCLRHQYQSLAWNRWRNFPKSDLSCLILAAAMSGTAAAVLGLCQRKWTPRGTMNG